MDLVHWTSTFMVAISYISVLCVVLLARMIDLLTELTAGCSLPFITAGVQAIVFDMRTVWAPKRMEDLIPGLAPSAALFPLRMA